MAFSEYNALDKISSVLCILKHNAMVHCDSQINVFFYILIYLGMLSAGILGGLLGLQGGCFWWLAQKATGETVEQRWKREYLQITRLQEIKVNTLIMVYVIFKISNVK